MPDYEVDLSPKKRPMPSQPPAQRATNFDEVALGYTLADALAESRRCLDCRAHPCVGGCPVGVPIPQFIARLRAGDLPGAYQAIATASSLPAVCGRVCPQESQCECRCVRGKNGEPVAIGRLERFVADWHGAAAAPAAPADPPAGAARVAVVGSGPAGLACAGDLARMGYAVTVFEALHTAGGVLVYGIPEFRLPKAIVRREVEALRALGVQVQTNMVIGRTLSVDELFAMGFAAVFIGSGAGLPNFMDIPGEGLNGVYSANEFLTRSNLMGAWRADAATPISRGGRVAVVGGGNVAMDAARTALRLGADSVHVVYRRSEQELPARHEEVEHAREEGVLFQMLCSPVEVCGYLNTEDPRDPKNGCVRALRCVRMQLGEPDERGRRRPVPLAGSAFELPVDTVIMAIGTSPNPLLKATTDGLQVNERGGIVIDAASGATSRPGVFAGGDAVTGAATVISAMGAGKVAAAGIDRYLRGREK